VQFKKLAIVVAGTANIPQAAGCEKSCVKVAKK
jgi:hypothetical protein